MDFTRMSVQGINKVKRELGFVLMALNIRKVTAQRAKNNQNKSDYFDNEKKIETKPNNDNLVKNETIKHLYNQLDIYKEQSKRDKDIE
ncbi:hypothetical protein ACUXKH_001861 [Staphylococcus epidermidis]